MNLALPAWTEPDAAVMQIRDAEAVVKMAERDPADAVAFLLATATPAPVRSADWPDQLARALAFDPHLRLQDWARQHHLADATVSRGFRQVFGLSPSAYRVQVRARIAWRKASSGRDSLSAIATDSGFYDQAHMTRTVRAITGQTPGLWRWQVK
jgi:AraC-like DNA-binding protein